jgi:hypothetical protein
MPSYLLFHPSHRLPTGRTGACGFFCLNRDSTDTFYSSANYTLIWNALDYPACVFPVTKVDPVLDQPKPVHDFLSEEDQKIYNLCTSDLLGDFPVLTTGF